MLTCNCPRCGETIGLPTAAVPADATAQCPWCGEIYPASEIIEKLPPMVELISADGQPLFLDAGDGAAAQLAAAPIASAASGANSFTSSFAPDADADQLNETWDDNSELTIEADGDAGFDLDGSLDGDPQRPEDNFNEGGQDDEMLEFLSSNDSEDESADSAGPLMPMKVKSVPVNTYKRKKSSPIKTLIGVAMGPLVALPLAGGILLWLGKAPDLGFWPFDGSFNNGSSSRLSAAPPMVMNDPVDPVAEDAPLTGSEMMVPAAEPSDDFERAQQELANLGADTNPADSVDDTPGGFDMPSLGSSLNPDSEEVENELATGEVEYPDAAGDDTLSQDVVADKVPMEMPAVEPSDIASEDVASEEVAGKIESIVTDDPAEDTSAIADEAPVAEVMEPAVEEASEPEPSAAAEAVAETAPAAESDVNNDPEQPAVSPAVEAAVEKANKLLASLMKFEGAEGDRRRLLAKAYASVSAVAIESNAGDNAAVQKLLNALSRSPLVKDLGDAADLWLDYGKRPTDGVLIIGAPATDAAGSVLRISSSSGDVREVPVSGSSLPEADQVIALGRIVEASDGPTVELVAVESMSP
ncbi:hypothetical protein RMSM_04975 [Rhodopirellula maiorica SM1]|uniref:Serine repeat-containing antigen n=1 Tax=Rhodopirellula maiorica SM1 TaxID=1265738 RepID=M5RG24_9BACT|nr:hypothetical protein [Rhodopirellula maiorica]EMI18096.1 hypothetical protein RMSM_04975 [Rhodopirellula maiorica SM1]